MTAWLALLSAFAPAALSYDNMYPTLNTYWSCTAGYLFCQTDNATFTVHRQNSLSDTGKANVAATLNDSFNTTDLNVSYQPTASYTGSAETDVIYQTNAAAMPDANTLGITYCDDPISLDACDQHYVVFRYATPKIALACHETGHAVGLTHGYDASPRIGQQDPDLHCMVATLIGDGDRWLGSHNASEINGTY